MGYFWKKAIALIWLQACDKNEITHTETLKINDGNN
jgi:hypothetical protein